MVNRNYNLNFSDAGTISMGISSTVLSQQTVKHAITTLVENVFGTLYQVSVMNEEEGNWTHFNQDEGIGFADKGFFELFDYEWYAGDPETALDQPLPVHQPDSTPGG